MYAPIFLFYVVSVAPKSRDQTPKGILYRFFKFSLQKNKWQREAIWQETLAEALSMGYPHMPPENEAIDRATFCAHFRQWQENEIIWKETWEEALGMGYPHMPRQGEAIDRDTFSAHFAEWKHHIFILNEICVQAKRAGYGIPDNFQDFSAEERSIMVQAYQEWEKQRVKSVNNFISQATAAGYPLPGDIHGLTFAEQESLSKEFMEWNKKRGSPDSTTKLMRIQLPSEAEVVLKTKAAMSSRKDTFKQTVDSDKARSNRAENRQEASRAKRADRLDTMRGRKQGPKKQSSAGQLLHSSLDMGQPPSIDEGNAQAPRAPVRRSSDRTRRPSQRQLESNGEHHPQVENVDSFDAKLDDLTYQFKTDVLENFRQLETELSMNGSGFGSSFDEETEQMN